LCALCQFVERNAHVHDVVKVNCVEQAFNDWEVGASWLAVFFGQTAGAQRGVDCWPARSNQSIWAPALTVPSAAPVTAVCAVSKVEGKVKEYSTRPYGFSSETEPSMTFGKAVISSPVSEIEPTPATPASRSKTAFGRRASSTTGDAPVATASDSATGISTCLT